MAINTIVFDFDGTLADTNGLVIDSWQHAYKKITGQTTSEEALYRTFGEPLMTSMEKAFGDRAKEAMAAYREFQVGIYEERIELFPGVLEMLKELKNKGYKVGIATSRIKSTTMVALNKFGLMEYLDALVTHDDTDKHKPDPEPVLICLEKLGSKPEETLMIGDSMFDIKCAHNAGVKAVLVGWALAVNEEEKKGPDAPEYFIERADDLFKILGE